MKNKKSPTIIVYWTAAAHTKDRALINPPRVTFRRGVLMPILYKIGYTTVLKSGMNTKIKNGLIKCTWSGFKVQFKKSIFPFINVACNIQEDPYSNETKNYIVLYTTINRDCWNDLLVDQLECYKSLLE